MSPDSPWPRLRLRREAQTQRAVPLLSDGIHEIERGRIQQAVQEAVYQRLRGPVRRRRVGTVQQQGVGRGKGRMHPCQPGQFRQQGLEQVFAGDLAQGWAIAELGGNRLLEIECGRV
ncbi:hypothetical protein [Pseudomonas sp.]|uniref:hypothetical protein n=1 Tax=Pseudomonas sp. TaxID=306 RepID=UPI0028A6627F|nr:hypothetical protein [Pseudomonas sp.]